MDVLKEERRNGQMEISILGIDLGKTSCSIVGCDGSGRVVRAPTNRLDALQGTPPCRVFLQPYQTLPQNCPALREDTDLPQGLRLTGMCYGMARVNEDAA